MFEQRDLAFAVAFETIAEIGAWEFEFNMLNPLAFASSNRSGNPDIMYIHEALKAPDRSKFLEAMIEEITSHTTRGHWRLIRRCDAPDGTTILPAVWSMAWKRQAATGEVYKHKARITVGGHKQEHGVNFWETYSPVVNWFTIRIFLVLTIIHGWKARQMDFVLAFPQADVETPLYMEVPWGFETKDGKAKEYCIELIKNV